MSDAVTPSPTPELDAVALSVASRIAVGILNGLMIKGVSLDQATRQVQNPSLCDLCFSSAVRLIEVNREHKSDLADHRLETVVSLYAGAISGHVANHKQPADALSSTNRDRDRLFAVANTLISSSLNRLQPGQQALPPTLADAWRRGTNVAESQSGGTGVRPPSMRPR